MGAFTYMDLDHLLANYLPGSYDNPAWGWDDELGGIEEHGPDGFATWDDFLSDVTTRGIVTPIELGPDGRVWEGHHRVCAAIKLNVETVPVIVHPEAGDVRCRWPMGHRPKHNCSCICALKVGHKGPHRCEADDAR